MATLVHGLIFACSILIIWFFAGVLIDAVHRIAKRSHRTGFMTSFFILGFLTSMSEISVAVNASLQGVPDISVGNLLGASFVLLMFVVPLLATIGNGVAIHNIISKRNLILSLAVIILPFFLIMDGTVSKADGLLCILAFGCLAYAMYRQMEGKKEIPPLVTEEPVSKESALNVYDLIKVTIAAVAVFVASKLLVEQAVYFSEALRIPTSLVGLILLSIGTNIPELVVVARSIAKRHKDIAFGDYIGSAATNTFIFGALASVNGTFLFDPSTFTVVTILMIIGTVLFYFFARSHARLSRAEGIILLAFYAVFIVEYFIQLARGVLN